MPYGGMSPYPNRYGGKGPTGLRLEAILNSLNLGRGTAYDTTSTSTVYGENMMLARGMHAAWAAMSRLGHAVDPQRVTGTMLARWEKIMGIVPSPNEDEFTRRAAVVANWQRWGAKFNTSLLMTTVQTLLGSTFVEFNFDTVASATTFWPGGTTSVYAPWSSTTRRIRIEVTQPAGMLDGEFYATVNAANAFLDGQAPADVTFMWWRRDAEFLLLDGPRFVLDSVRNLGGDAFRV